MRRKRFEPFWAVFLITSLTLISACTKSELIQPAGFGLHVETDSIIFAIIGDYGDGDIDELRVAELVDSWNPDFIITTGDNNYEEGKFNTIQTNISDLYAKYIYNYDAPRKYLCYGKAYETGINRFFPTPGNHDANNREGLIPYYNFFTLPEREQYYKFTWGPVSFYSLNSIEENLDEQKFWLEQQLLKSNSTFNVIYSHMAPYSAGSHGNHENMQWDYYNMGADAFIAGHDHIYSRIEKFDEPEMVYIINGLGGKNRHGCNVYPLPSDSFSAFCYNNDFGAIRGKANYDRLILEFFSLSSDSEPIDRVIIYR